MNRARVMDIFSHSGFMSDAVQNLMSGDIVLGLIAGLMTRHHRNAMPLSQCQNMRFSQTLFLIAMTIEFQIKAIAKQLLTLPHP